MGKSAVSPVTLSITDGVDFDCGSKETQFSVLLICALFVLRRHFPLLLLAVHIDSWLNNGTDWKKRFTSIENNFVFLCLFSSLPKQEQQALEVLGRRKAFSPNNRSWVLSDYMFDFNCFNLSKKPVLELVSKVAAFRRSDERKVSLQCLDAKLRTKLYLASSNLDEYSVSAVSRGCSFRGWYVMWAKEMMWA